MQCPNCHQPQYTSLAPCRYCGFSGDAAHIEELSHIHWLLDELPAWEGLEWVPSTVFPRLKVLYTHKRRQLERDLGLRYPALSKEAAASAWISVFRYNVLLDQLTRWRVRGYVKAEAAQFFLDDVRLRRDELLARLAECAPPDVPPTDTDRLGVVKALLSLVGRLRDANVFTRSHIAESLLHSIQAEQARLSIALGWRQAPDVPQMPPAKPEAGSQKQKGGAEKPARTMPTPITAPQPTIPFRERFWRMFLSKRMLNAMLFLGMFLIFAAAISFVIWGWKDFSPPLRVVIPAGFTALFFTLGWYVRKKTTLYNSGIALSAIAALLIPINFYTIYVNFDFPPHSWPEFWLVTSLLCLGAYLLVTYIIQNWIFGYLVGLAAGSIVLAGIEVAHKWLDLSPDWYGAGLSGLAVAFVFVAHALSRRDAHNPWRVLIAPLRYLALLGVGVLMPLLLGWRILDRTTYDALHYALSFTWLIGGGMFAWGAVHYRSRGLGMLAATALPVAVYMTQAALFDARDVASAWHALGWACLAPLYIVFGYRLSRSQGTRSNEAVAILLDHARTANRWAVRLIIGAALWSLTDLSRSAAAATSHLILAGAVALAAILWCRPRYVYPASLLALTATTFGMTELDVTVAQLCVGWASLAIAHIVLAYRLSCAARLDTHTRRFCVALPTPHRQRGGAISRYPAAFVAPLITAGYGIALLSLLPPLWPYDGDLLAYTLGNVIVLALWGARLAHLDFWGFSVREVAHRMGPLARISAETLRRWHANPRKVRFHWLAALLFPVWLWVLYTNRRPAGMPLALALTTLAWGLVALGEWLKRVRPVYARPWRRVGLLTSVVACIAAFTLDVGGFAPVICLLSAGWLYFVDAHLTLKSYKFIPAGLVTAWGVVLMLRLYDFSADVQALGVAALVALYFVWAMQVERRKLPYVPETFFRRLYQTIYVLTLAVLAHVYMRPLMDFSSHVEWTDVMQRWGAATQLLLGVGYGFYAWHTYRERWGHVAAWLGTAGAGMLVLAYSQGRGSSAAKAALIAIAYVLAERGLYWLRDAPHLARRGRAYARLAWTLYRRPLLLAGWTISVGTIGLALIRNLWLLGGGRIRQTWAIAGLLLITGLYATSARMFRKPHYVWFAALLLFAPWTILTDIGWFTAYRLTVPGFAFSWVLLSWTLFLVNLVVQHYAPNRYARPLRVVAHLWVPFALLWAIADAETSRVTFGLAVAFYAFASWRDWMTLGGDKKQHPHKRLRFAYPALAFVPVWCIYLLAWYVPQSPHELYGLILLPFAPIGLWAGHWLRRLPEAQRLKGKSEALLPVSCRLPPAFGLPAYLPAYLSLIVATLLVAHSPALLAVVLLYDTLLLMASARVFRDAAWAYPAAGALTLAVLLALGEADVPHNRQGWWLVGLAAVYFALAWLLRRVKLSAYSTAPLAVGSVVLALSLPPSSQDQLGALWGYGSAALLYAILAAWLRQPLLLWPTGGLAVVAYLVGLQRSPLAPLYYGLWLFPGTLAALALGVLLDARCGAWRDFPWGHVNRWLTAFIERLFKWWALPLYVLGLGLGMATPWLTAGHIDWRALNWLLLVPIFAWAVWRFRLRIWLLTLTLAAHFALAAYLDFLGWWGYPAWAWAYFSPLMLLTVGVGLWLERRFNEGAPFASRFSINASVKGLRGGGDFAFWRGWSRPLYLVAGADMLLAQVISVWYSDVEISTLLTVTHALVLVVLVSVWQSRWLPYVSAGLGGFAVLQWWAARYQEMAPAAWLRLPVWLAWLAFAYGLVGYGLTLWRRGLGRGLQSRSEGADAAHPPARARRVPAWLEVWRHPLERSALALSGGALFLMLATGLNVLGWLIMALIGWPFREAVDLASVRMVVTVLSWVGLLYVTATVVYQRVRWGYVAFGMLLSSWMLYAFFIRQWEGLMRVQWYALPVGVYLLGIALMEWRDGHKTLARRLDYAAMLLMIGSLFWQTLDFGWRYALLLGAEGFALVWWGSARRSRRFFYAGMVSVMLATIGQLINALQDVNQWIVFGLIGLLLFGGAALIERKLEEITAALRVVLEDWE